MLERLKIDGLGIVDGVEAEFSPRLTAITGETGAGKTLVLTGLNFLLGEAAVKDLPSGSDIRAEASFYIGDDGEITELVAQAGGQVDEGFLEVSRRIPQGGRSRSHAGGVSVPRQVLTRLGGLLVNVHGQSDQQRLRATSAQREALDRYAGPKHARVLRKYRAAWEELGQLEAKLEAHAEDTRVRATELAGLRAQLAHYEEIDPSPGEDDELRALALRVENLASLREAAATAHTTIRGEEYSEGVTQALARAVNALNSSEDPVLEGLGKRVEEAIYLLEDIAPELTTYLEGLDSQPADPEQINARRARLNELLRLHPSLEEASAWATTARERIEELEGGGMSLEQVARDVEAARERALKLADEISAGRRRAAVKLSGVVTGELAGLAMAGSEFSVAVNSGPELGPRGLDEVEFLLRAHAGAPMAPLARTASGGELSRIMLALELALAHTGGENRGAALLFDEIDAGVGGRAALEIGRRLARLAKTRQVIVVTHLPQVAAAADRHVVVVKTSVGKTTRTSVKTLDREQRVTEIARMLAGDQESNEALRHAEALLAGARETMGE